MVRYSIATESLHVGVASSWLVWDMQRLCGCIGQCMLDGYWVHSRAQHNTQERFFCYSYFTNGYVWSRDTAEGQRTSLHHLIEPCVLQLPTKRDLHHILLGIFCDIPFRSVPRAHHDVLIHLAGIIPSKHIYLSNSLTSPQSQPQPQPPTIFPTP